jgi:SAM-dependent methyltransferase
VTRLYEAEAEIYDIAFDWDVTDEVRWLLERLGPACRSVLEPGCGSGRMLAALAREGVDAVGVDLSPAMVRLAERRVPGRAVLADMTDFDLGRTFDGAICPINTLAHLKPDALARHLGCTARQLRPRAAYLVQLAIFAGRHGGADSSWEATRGDVTLRVLWANEELDLKAGRARDRSRIEVVTGPRRGAVLEETHELTAWTAERWATLVVASPFEQTAQFDGDDRARPEVDVGAPGGLMWHELRLASG